MLIDLRRGGDLISMQLEAKLLTAPKQQLRGVRVRLTKLTYLWGEGAVVSTCMQGFMLSSSA